MKAAIPSKFATLAVLAFVLVGVCTPEPGLAQDPTGVQFEPELIKILETDWLYVGEGEISPDGRWTVFSGGESLSQYSLFVTPTAGGELVRLTEGNFNDVSPRWSPDGLFIYFRSDRLEGPTSGNSFIMRMPFDPDTGTATDVPRPVVLEPAIGRFSLSPDGEWIAYPRREPEGAVPFSSLRVAPSAGGAATTVLGVESGRGVWWAADGHHLFYLSREYGERGEGDRVRPFVERVWRVSRDGGTPEMLTARDGWVLGMSRSGDQILWTKSLALPGPREITVTDLRGSVQSTLTLPEDVRAGYGQVYGTELTASSSESGMPIWVMSLSDGELQEVSGFGVEDDPVGWLHDNRLLVKSSSGSPEVGYWDQEMTYHAYDPESGALAPVEGLEGIRAEYPIAFSDDGSTALIVETGSLRGGERGSGALKLLDLVSGDIRTLFESTTGSPGISALQVMGRGGIGSRDSEYFYYPIWQANQRDLYRVRGLGEPELVWTFRRPSRSFYAGEIVGVHGNRIAWIDSEPGDTLGRDGDRVMLADLGTGGARELYRTEATLESTLVWSNDGTKLAMGYRMGDGRLDLAILEVSPAGEVVGEPRIIPVGSDTWYDLRWLPGDEAVALLAFGIESAIDTDVFLIDVSEGISGPPRALKGDHPFSVWTYELSPDGRYIAFATERPATATLWRMTLPDVGGR
jgi:hypothetical protein